MYKNACLYIAKPNDNKSLAGQGTSDFPFCFVLFCNVRFSRMSILFHSEKINIMIIRVMIKNDHLS